MQPSATTGPVVGPFVDALSPRNKVAAMLGKVDLTDAKTSATAASAEAEAEAEARPQQLCEVCSLGARLYKCPRCALFSCSLACCKLHKTQMGCSGKRDRAAYVATAAFDERSLRSDFHFLEDVLQSRDRYALLPGMLQFSVSQRQAVHSQCLHASTCSNLSLHPLPLPPFPAVQSARCSRR